MNSQEMLMISFPFFRLYIRKLLLLSYVLLRLSLLTDYSIITVLWKSQVLTVLLSLLCNHDTSFYIIWSYSIRIIKIFVMETQMLCKIQILLNY